MDKTDKGSKLFKNLSQADVLKMLFLRSFDKPEVLHILCDLNVKFPMLFLPAPNIILIVHSVWGSQMEKVFYCSERKQAVTSAYSRLLIFSFWMFRLSY